jgi:hypothetical protein
MQVTIARQLGLDPSTVSNFFMNARRRSVDKWKEDSLLDDDGNDTILEGMSDCDDDDDDQSSSDEMSSDHYSQIQSGQGAVALARYTDGIVKVFIPNPVCKSENSC